MILRAVLSGRRRPAPRTGVTLTEGDRGLLDLDEILRDRFGRVVSALFLVGFWATSFSSLLGVWQGVRLLVTDFVRTRREAHGRLDGGPRSGYLLWLTSPPMSLVSLGQPFVIVVVHGAIGAFLMPFLALTPVWLLTSSRTPAQWPTDGCPPRSSSRPPLRSWCSASSSSSGSPADPAAGSRDTPQDTPDTRVTG